MNTDDETYEAKIEYSIVVDSVCGVEFFGVSVEMTAHGEREAVELRELTSDRALAERIAEAMRRGGVTPCAAQGVAQDMLAEDVMMRECADARAFENPLRGFSAPPE